MTEDTEDPQYAHVLEAADKAWHYVINECEDEHVETVDHYINQFGTKAAGSAIDGMEYTDQLSDACQGHGLERTLKGVACEPICIEFSRSMSMLLTPKNGEVLPELGADGHYVVECFPSLGQKRTVVERENNIISLDEARAHVKECDKAMFDELTRWHSLGAFERMPKRQATNVIDARWVLKWKEVNGKRIIRARVVVRGFKDLQAAQLSTFAGTTTRWGQRLVNSIAVQHG